MQQFTAADGTRIAFEVEGVGRPLVLLHGLMAHRGFFAPQSALADAFRIVRVDLRGHGGSRIDGQSASIETLADDVAGLAGELDLQDAIGVGWSLGATVLWRLLAGPAGKRFAGAVVIDMAPRVLNGDGWELGLSRETCEARSRAIAGDFPAFARQAGAAIFAQPPGDDGSAAWAGEEFARNDPAAIAGLWESLVAEDLRPLLPAIRQPTLVVHGGQSHLYGEGTAEHLVAALPHARAVRFERSGHAPHLQEPELFNRTLRDFAASLPPVRTLQNAD